MSKPVFQDLLNQQIAVMKAISYVVAVFMPSLLALLYFSFEVKNLLPSIILPYVFIVLVNILVLPLHQKAYITYYVLIGATFLELMAIIFVTGGLLSPLVFILVSLPGFAFYTSSKQGKIWFAICFVSVLLLYIIDYKGISIINITNDNFRIHFLFLILLFVIILSFIYTLLVKQASLKAHRLFNYASKDIEEKSKRLENMVMLVNYSNELMCVIDQAALTFDEVNPVFKIVLGYELSELRGQHLTKLIKDEALPLFTSVKENQSASFESAVIYKNGKEKIFRWSVNVKNGKLYANARDVGE